MMELIRVEPKRWLIRNYMDNLYIIGSLPDVATAMEHRGIAKTEVLAAIEAMLMNKHNVAEFGVNNRFTFSTWRESNELFRN